MRVLLIFCILIGGVLLKNIPENRNQNQRKVVETEVGETPEIVLFETDDNTRGYVFRFQNPEGTSRSEKTHFIETYFPPIRSLSVEGNYSWFDKSGIRHQVQYRALDRGQHIHPNTTA